MIPKQLDGFITRLADETESGKVQWYEGHHKAYFCENKNFILHIFYGFDETREESFYSFKIMNGEQTTPFSVASFEDGFFLMKRLYEAAIVNANNIVGDLDSFFDG